MNILVLGLSTFNGDNDEKLKCLKLNTQKTYLGEDIFTGLKLSGYYQLEPVPKMLSSFLATKGEKLDVIITMNTNAVEEKREISASCLGEKTKKISPYEFFEDRLRQGDLAISEECFPEIMPVRKVDENYYAGIFEVVTNIRQRSENTEQKICLWVDDHGGFREISTALQAIISLLKHEGIQLEKAFTVKHENGSDVADKVVPLKSSGIFEFVSGMNEFSYYGKSAGLLEFVKMETSGKENKDTEEDKDTLAKYMNQISDAIQLCDMTQFDETLSQLGSWIQRYNKTGNELIDIFIDNIIADYGDLLDKEKRNILGEIKWCLKKGYLQQALTLIESKIPEEFCELDIIRLKKDDELFVYRGESTSENRKTWKRTNTKLTLNKALESAKEKSQKTWESDINYLFPRWCSVNSQNGQDEYIKLNQGREEYLRKQQGTSSQDKLLCKRPVYVYTGNDRRVEARITVNAKILEIEKNQKTFNKILLLHRALKNQRNTTNHAVGGERYSAQNIRDAIGAYIDLVQEIYIACGVGN